MTCQCKHFIFMHAGKMTVYHYFLFVIRFIRFNDFHTDNGIEVFFVVENGMKNLRFYKLFLFLKQIHCMLISHLSSPFRYFHFNEQYIPHLFR
ncbi:hypothetical protein BMB171_C4057 [Bacillus thuringiensis BMB171]|nr:hypothetical protein BMB171_C4057 [Bacillus thuringiensis BMB171]